ncbi:hypothetical protein [Kordia sp.]|uniref:hypothetical protein n=1 Tax=Kordia sp. TaxID=1965332 RepID=UPI003B5AE381
MFKIDDKTTAYFPNLYAQGIQIIGEKASIWRNKEKLETLHLSYIDSIELTFLETKKVHKGFIQQLTNRFFNNKKTNTELTINIYEIKFNFNHYRTDNVKDTFHIEINHGDVTQLTEEIKLFNESVDHTFELYRKKTKATIQKEHKALVETVPTLIRELKRFLKKQTFDYSLREIDMFEDFFRAHLVNPKQVGLTKESLDKLFIAYIATAFFWYLGGKWDLDTEKNSETYGASYAVTTYARDYNTSICMAEWIFLIRTGQMDERLASFFDRMIYFYKQNPEVTLKPIRNQY